VIAARDGGWRRLGRCGERCVYGWDFGRNARWGHCETGGLTGCRWGGIVAEWGLGGPSRSLNYLHPPESRLSLRPDGRVAYSLKKTWRDGSTHVVMEPQVLIERLLALVPRPRRHLVTYHGVLAPGASMRDLVVPPADEDGEQEEVDEGVADAEEARSDEVAALSVGQQVARVPHRPGKRRRGVRRHYTPQLRWEKTTACRDPGSGFDSAGAAVARAFWRSAGVGACACAAW
jgi:hypothetical protein